MPDVEFSRAVSWKSHWIDRRRPRYLTDADRELMEEEPQLQAAIRWQVELEEQCEDSDDPTLLVLLKDQERKVRNLHRSLQEKRRMHNRQDFS